MSPITPSHVDETTDTEITLGTGKMLALFFGLVILCAVFFGMGFSMGKNSVRSGPELLPSPSSSGTRRPEGPAKPVGNAAPPSDSKAGDQTPSSADAGSGSNPAPATSDQPAPAAI